MGSPPPRRRSPPTRTSRSTRRRRCGRGPKSEITEEQYHEFYKHVAHDFEPPLAYSHARVEGRQEYTQLLFIPQRAPFDLWDRDHRHGIKLYIRRVFIMDDAEQLMPAYLRFVRGVDRLERSAAQRVARDPAAVGGRRADPRGVGQARARPARRSGRQSARQVRDVLEGVRPRVQGRRGRGHRQQGTHRQAAAVRLDACRFSRADGVARRLCRADEEGQDAIYYITADGFSAAKNSPHLEVFRKLGVEVLLMSDRVDEWVLSSLTEFDGKPLQSVASGDLDLEQAGRRAGEAGRRRSRKARTRTARAHPGRARGARQRRAPDAAPDRFAGLPGQRRARHEHAPRAPAEGGGPERARQQAGARDQPGPPDRGALEAGVRRERCSPTGARSCSTRRCWPRAASSTTRRRSSSA